MFTGPVMLLPGQELRDFTVFRPETRRTDRGQAVIGGYMEIGGIRAILAQASPQEIERWRQLGHPVTHKIIMQRTPAFDVLPGDIFEYAGRRFYIKAMPHNVGDISRWTIFYCEERFDLNERGGTDAGGDCGSG